MAVDVNFGILRPSNIGESFTAAFQQGRQERAQAETDNALAALAQNPDADINALAKYNPRLVYQVNTERRNQQQAASQAQTVGDALNGNPAARGQVAYFDPEMFLKLQGKDREVAKDAVASISQVLQWADSPEKFDAVVRQMATQDPQYLNYLGRFGEREAILAQAGDLVKAMTPDIGYVPADATAYSKNPAGEGVLRALNGQPPVQQVQQSPVNAAPPENPNPSAGVTVASPEQIAAVAQAFGGDQAKTQEYLSRNNIIVGKQVNGQTYYQINGQWFDNPEGR